MKKRLILLTTAALVMGLIPQGVQAQSAGPTIQLLNPSGYSGATAELSTKGNLYHFVASVSSVPATPLVEFEIRPTVGNAVTIDAQRVGSSDTWEAFHNLAGLTDGQYTVEAILYSGGTQVGDVDSQPVTINNSDIPLPPEAESAEFLHPSNGGSLGFFTPQGGSPSAIVDVAASEGARQVRALYSISAPGTEPAWSQCGTANVSGGVARVRCTLGDGVAPSSVRAVAAVANVAISPAPATASTDDSGDAHRVTPYEAQPVRVAIDPEASKQETGPCFALTAQVTDQFSRPLAGVNVDVHAEGPNDQLQFGSISNTTSAFKAPDKGPHGSENARNCADGSASGQQGDTNRVGAADQKHIESTTGTNNSGNFTFALRSGQTGGTTAIAWADTDDDDLQQPSEASGGARIGWGEDPPQAVTQVFLEPSSGSTTVGSCQRFVLTVKEGGSPSAGSNADVHISSSDTTPSFCSPSDASPTRAPDQGDHVAGAHPDGTQHVEGELDIQGRLIFGVSAASEGRVSVEGWLDGTDDDTLGAGEKSASATADFVISGDRDASLSANRNRVKKGRRVRLSGGIDGAPACSEGQVVRLRAKVPGKRFKTIAKKRTNDEGNFTFRPKVFRTKIYKAIAPRNGVCDRAGSRNVRVRAKR